MKMDYETGLSTEKVPAWKRLSESTREGQSPVQRSGGRSGLDKLRGEKGRGGLGVESREADRASRARVRF